MSERTPSIDQDGMRLSFSKLLESGRHSDLSFIVGPEKEKFKVHKAILCANSRFFDAACKHPFKENAIQVIKLPEQSPEIIKYVLEFLYSGKYNAGDTAIQEDVDIFLSAVFLEIDALKEFSTNVVHDCLQGGLDWIPDSVIYECLEKIYSATSSSDRSSSKFRRILHSIMQPRLDLLLRKDKFQALLLKHKELGVEIFQCCVDSNGFE